MGHLLSTVNPEAAARIGTKEDAQNIASQAALSLASPPFITEGIPPSDNLPEIGEPIRYHLRTGDYRAGRSVFPAQVVATYPERGTIDLVAFFDAEDRIDQRNAVQWDGNGPGWERIPPRVITAKHGSQEISALRKEMEELHTPADLLADYAQQIVDLTVANEKLEKRVAKLEKIMKK